MPRRSRQRKHGGGRFASERQRRFLWATRPAAARKWAHNRHTRKTDWVPRRGTRVYKRRRK
jgi:hypothetical protein